jgi:O-antigen ligase
MSNTAILRTTEPAATDGATAKAATVVAAILFTVAIISFRPFQPAGGGVTEAGAPAAGGDVLNQLGFGGLGAVSIIAILCLADPRRISVLFSPWWLLMLAFVTASVLNAGDPSSAMRTAAFTVIGMITMWAVLVLPRDAEGFSKVLATMALTVIGLSYVGLVVFPDIAIHSAASQEPQHAGLWRGLFPHKNMAGPVMACISFAGFYLYRRGWKWIGVGIFVAAMIFVANTGSKTTAGLVPMAILIVAMPSVIGMRRITIILFFAAIAGTALGTVGIVYLDFMKALATDYFPGLTYSGRTALWQFAGEMLVKQPWTGYGFDSFWGTRLLSDTVQPFDREWDIRTIVHGHNGYVDIALTMGIPALLIAVMTFIVEPARDYMRVPHKRENIFLADFFMMALLFTTLNAFLESFFFRRADPVWLFVVLSATGLRLVSRFPVKTSKADAIKT